VIPGARGKKVKAGDDPKNWRAYNRSLTPSERFHLDRLGETSRVATVSKNLSPTSEWAPVDPRVRSQAAPGDYESVGVEERDGSLVVA
jgi:hypothetical protein